MGLTETHQTLQQQFKIALDCWKFKDSKDGTEFYSISPEEEIELFIGVTKKWLKQQEADAIEATKHSELLCKVCTKAWFAKMKRDVSL